MTITFKGIEFGNRREAIEYAEAGGGRAVSLAGGIYVVTVAEAHRLEETGVEFAYLGDHEMPNGEHRIVSIPVNDGPAH